MLVTRCSVSSRMRIIQRPAGALDRSQHDARSFHLTCRHGPSPGSLPQGLTLFGVQSDWSGYAHPSSSHCKDEGPPILVTIYDASSDFHTPSASRISIRRRSAATSQAQSAILTQTLKVEVSIGSTRTDHPPMAIRRQLAGSFRPLTRIQTPTTNSNGR
jgi:hypothetical protein